MRVERFDIECREISKIEIFRLSSFDVSVCIRNIKNFLISSFDKAKMSKSLYAFLRLLAYKNSLKKKL